VPFPKTFLPAVKKVLSRLFRVFVHVYIHHFDKLVSLGAVSRLVVARQLQKWQLVRICLNNSHLITIFLQYT
jgi:hypothetical protein